jgi:O-antigen/teichoic acid export membrane protein
VLVAEAQLKARTVLADLAEAAQTFWWPVRTLLLGAGGAQALTILALPLLARIYEPAAFGRFSVYFGIVGVVGAASALRFEIAIQVARRESIASALRHAGVVSSMACGGAGVLLGAVAVALGRSDVAFLVFSGGVGSGLVGLWLIASHWQLRLRRFRLVAASKIVQSAATVTAQLCLFVFGHIGLIAGDLIGRVSAYVAVRRGAETPRVSASRQWRVVGAYRRYPVYAAPAAAVNASGIYLVPVAVFFLYGATEAGLFGLVFRLISLPVALVGTAVAQVYVREAGMHAGARNYRALRQLAHQFVVSLAAVGTVILLLIVALGSSILVPALGPQWSGAGGLLLPLSLAAIAQFAVSPVSQTLNLIRRQRTQLLWDSGRLLVVVGSVALAYFAGWGFLQAVWLYGAASAMAYIVLWLLSSREVSSLLADAERADGYPSCAERVL